MFLPDWRVDFFISGTIFYFGYWMLEDIGFLSFSPVSEPDTIQMLVKWANPELSILFYSTFSTSVIFYLYCLSTLLFKFVRLSKTRIMVVLEKLEDSDHLFKALGGFLAAVVVFVKAVVEIIQYIA